MGDGRFRAVLLCYVVVDVDVNANFVAAERLFLWKFGSCVCSSVCNSCVIFKIGEEKQKNKHLGLGWKC